ncbi:MAG: DUF5916 domain-containing protein, partial [Bacteroidota bacterium]|nr:DUF5916 domain-containing protein [Bacteroidota bacterium]
NEVTYFVNKPVSIFRTYSITLEQFNSWNFNGTYLGSGSHLSATGEFRNQWKAEANLIVHSGAFDTKILRGGYDMRMPGSVMTFGSVQSDPSKKVTGEVEFRYESRGSKSASIWEVQPSISVRPLSILKIGVKANYEENHDELQYVSTWDPGYLAKRYILGTIDQKTLGLTFRADLNLSPEFSIQYYGSPFISKGTYSQFKRITNPRASDYTDRFAIYESPVLSDGVYQLTDTDNGWPIVSFVDNPNFNFHEFRSNLVAKWEYRLGSFIYLVWSSSRTGSNAFSDVSIGESYRYLRDVFPHNIFLIKLSYWFSL